jgi:hypothetical protein
MTASVFDSITHVGPEMSGKAVLAASHAGVFVAHMTLDLGLAAVVLCDAGIGRERAGVAGLAVLASHQVPAAAIDASSARIGDGADCHDNGTISVANAVAEACGVTAGMPAAEALRRFAGHAPSPRARAGGAPPETRRTFDVGGRWRLVLIDSASLVRAEDSDAVVVTGSHGGLLGGKAATALKYPARAAIFNDAGGGRDLAGASRLAALDVRGIPAATVSAWSARIGDAASTFADGCLSHINDHARSAGAEIGQPCRDFVAALIGVDAPTLQRRIDER